VHEREGQALLFLEHHLRDIVAVPKLYAMYRIAANGHLCLIMERVQGESLEEMWPTLGENEKSALCRQLREMFQTIRDIRCPNFYGSVEKGLVPHHLFHSRDGDRAICGPFDSEHDFNAGLVRKLQVVWAENGRHSYKADFYEKNLDNVLNGHRPVFSHSDLQRKNILVHRAELQASSIDKPFKVALIDWEDAGWYPSYWEYAAIFVAFEWTDDWPQRLEEIIDPWPKEAAMLRMLYQDLCF
jgi:aminoglycoside phosphotransferase (APT) family kinase protein